MYHKKRVIVTDPYYTCDYNNMGEPCDNELEGKFKGSGWIKLGDKYYCPEHKNLKGIRPTKFRKEICTCTECGKDVQEVLDLDNPKHKFCSFECERKFWLDILY